jgi:aspartyl-tRNA(Asn)/glutamyl-tRNA(Gln) amidotransferase subunit A
MLLDLTLSQLQQGLRAKKFSSQELLQESLDNIKRYNPDINALITPVDAPTGGIPFVLKDVYVTEDILTTAASNVLKNYQPQYNATVYKKLVDAGFALVGKANQDAWGHGGTSENTDFGPVKNPWDKSRSAGGSSGGCAAAISTRMAAFAIGEDTGGSIRNPSAWCNTTGLKVTYGRVSRYGAIAYASSFDTVGPMAKTAEDCAIILEAIAGSDPYDATSSPHAVPVYSKLLNQPISGLTIGMPKELFTQGLDPEIKLAIYEAIKQYEKLGVKIKQISTPLLDFGLAVYYLIAPSETSSNLARYDGIRYGLGRDQFTEETMRRIMIGTYALSAGYYDAYYRKAQQARTLFIKEYAKALSQCDVLVMPVTSMPPTKIGEFTDDPMQNYLIDVYTTTQNPVGIPALALPCGFTKNNLPIGMQLVGPMFSEELLLRLGHQYQQATDWHTQKPLIL